MYLHYRIFEALQKSNFEQRPTMTILKERERSMYLQYNTSSLERGREESILQETISILIKREQQE